MDPYSEPYQRDPTAPINPPSLGYPPQTSPSQGYPSSPPHSYPSSPPHSYPSSPPHGGGVGGVGGGVGGGYPPPSAPPPSFEPDPYQSKMEQSSPGADGSAPCSAPSEAGSRDARRRAPPPSRNSRNVTVDGQPLFNRSTYITCPHCKTPGDTIVEYKTGLGTWGSCGGLVLIGCLFGCCLIPFCVKELKDSYHVCPNCSRQVGCHQLIRLE